ncbi:14195_t:CDS:1, partial [Cetraspora pellucida]
ASKQRKKYQKEKNTKAIEETPKRRRKHKMKEASNHYSVIKD